MRANIIRYYNLYLQPETLKTRIEQSSSSKIFGHSILRNQSLICLLASKKSGNQSCYGILILSQKIHEVNLFQHRVWKITTRILTSP